MQGGGAKATLTPGSGQVFRAVRFLIIRFVMMNWYCAFGRTPKFMELALVDFPTRAEMNWASNATTSDLLDLK